MILSVLYFILALLGIGFLIFIHELGHYLMAKRVGITIEVFSIGFGKPIAQWEKNGVKWQIGWIPLGGYVRQKGLEKKGLEDPHKVEGGFFAAKPWNRIKFLAAGPLVNILFALFAFVLLWGVGGREKPFSEFTSYIGWVDKDSQIYQAGIRPGDEILQVNGKPFTRFEELLYAAMVDDRSITIDGERVDYLTGARVPFSFSFSTESRTGEERAAQVFQSIRPAAYLLFDQFSSPKSPMEGSGIEPGDRLLWLDGNLLFSREQMITALNSGAALCTVEREGEQLLVSVPRVLIRDLRLGSVEKGELDDWRVEANLSGKASDLYFLPFNLSAQAVVEGPIEYIDEEAKPQTPSGKSEDSLLVGDKIVAVYGERINSSYELLQKLQVKKSLLIVKKGQKGGIPAAKMADDKFAHSFSPTDLVAITQTIGAPSPRTQSEDLSLLGPMTPVPFHTLHLAGIWEKQREERIKAGQEAIEGIEDLSQKEIAERRLEKYQSRLMLGIGMKDEKVRYNPNPITLFADVAKSTVGTLYATFTGYLKVKNLSGPVGMVQIVQKGWSEGAQDALYWLGMISFNLGLLNLFPFLPLDGGHIVVACVEWVRKKPLSMKTIERLYIPSAILFVCLFLYIIYNDIARVLGRFF